MVLKKKVFVEEKSSELPEEKERGESQELEEKKPYMERCVWGGVLVGDGSGMFC